jgi:hypothetical protein
MHWGNLFFAALCLWLCLDQGSAFARARRTGVTYIGMHESIPVKKADDPSLFLRNMWSKGILSGVMAASAIFLATLAFRPA